jgi:hypothetical protein
LKYILTTTKKCVDCLKDYLGEPEVCNFVVPINLSEASAVAVNSGASGTMRIGFKGESDFANALTSKMFMEAVSIEIPEMDSKDYSSKLERREGEYLIDITANTVRNDPVLLKVTPTKETILTEPSTGQTLLVFMPTSATKSITLKPAPNQQVLGSLQTLGESSSGAIDTISKSMTILSGFSIIASSPLMSPLIKFLKTFKLISRLKLINIFFGAYLEMVLDITGNMFNMGGDSQDPKLKRFDMVTRGKISKFKITSVSVDAIWIKYSIYFLIVFLRLYQALLRKYQSFRKNLSSGDQIMDRIADESRIIIFTMVVIDIAFYSFHCLSHMSLTAPQTRDSIISYILSVISIIFITADVLLLFQSNEEMTAEILLYEKELLEHKELKNKARLKRLEDQQKAVRVVDGNPVRADGKKMTVMEHLETDGFFMKRKPREVSSVSAVKFFAEDIKMEKLDKGRYFNTISMVKLLIVEPFYVTFQMFPNAQILILLALQTGYFVYFCGLAFKHKVFLSRLTVCQVFFSELSLLLFLMVGGIFQIAGGMEALPLQFSTALQIVGIVMLGLSTIMGTVVMVFSILKTIVSLVFQLKNYLLKMRYRKAFPDQDERRANSNPATVAPMALAPKFIVRSNLKAKKPSELALPELPEVQELTPDRISRPRLPSIKDSSLEKLKPRKSKLNHRVHIKSKKKELRNEEEAEEEKGKMKLKKGKSKPRDSIVKKPKEAIRESIGTAASKEIKISSRKLLGNMKKQVEI